MALPQPDPGVLRKAQRGDERAFSIIVRTYEQPVFNYVLRLTGDRSLSEDPQEDLLRQILGEAPVARQPKHVVEHRLLVRPNDDRKRTLIASLSLAKHAEVWLWQRHARGV